ncbi:MAG: hypothetical protein ACHQNV_06060, partial [Vicinamibacteria bacterium]
LYLSELAERLAPLIEKALLAERAPERARAEVRLLRAACSRDADKRLAEIGQRHPDPAVRAVINE